MTPFHYRARAERVRPVVFRRVCRVAKVTDGDSLVVEIGTMVVVGVDVAQWCEFLCPCGCGEVVRLNLLRSRGPAWRLALNAAGLPTLRPSVIRRSGCRSHFLV